MNSNWKRIYPAVLTAVVLAGVFSWSDTRAESEPFPIYESIKPNVAFWTQIYTQYESNQGVIHDKRYLNRIYDVIELAAPDNSGGRKINRQRIKKAKKNIRQFWSNLCRAARLPVR